MESNDMKRPTGQLCKVQFNKSITVIGKVTFDTLTGKYHIEGRDNRTNEPIDSWIDSPMVSLIEDANDRERRRYEEDRSRL